MNRRHFLTIAGSVLVAAQHSGSAKVIHRPDSFASRVFVSIQASPSADDVRAVDSSVFHFTSVSDARLAVSHLSMKRETEDRGEIYISNVELIEEAPEEVADASWFATYTTIAGVAGFKTQHAHAIFATGNLLHEIEVTSENAAVASTLLLDLADIVLATTTDRENGLWSHLVDLEDLPDNLKLYQQVDSQSIFDSEGTPVPGDIPEWDQIGY